jgi:Gluconate 2-dehydrogenase subunit 3
MSQHRRDFLLASAAGLVGTGLWLQAPGATNAAGATPFKLRSLTPAEVATLDALGETLLPGAAAAGISAYVDAQLALSAAEQTLMIKYLGVPPPFASFYQMGIKALDEFSIVKSQHAYAALTPPARLEVLRAVGDGAPTPWSGPPAGLFHFVLRNDALDVVYGTRRGFASLGVPYMAHILPPTSWPL